MVRSTATPRVSNHVAAEVTTILVLVREGILLRIKHGW
jgi:hypothetical protein